MAVELNLPADSDQPKEEGRVELLETAEPDTEVPESSSPHAVSMSVLTEKTGSEPPAEGIKEDDNKHIEEAKSEDEKIVKAEKEKETGTEVKETEPVVLRDKSNQDDEKDLRRGSTFLTEVEDNDEINEPKPRKGSIVDRILAESETDGGTNRVEVDEPECIEIKVQPLGEIKDEVDSKQEILASTETCVTKQEVDSKAKEEGLVDTKGDEKNGNTKMPSAQKVEVVELLGAIGEVDNKEKEMCKVENQKSKIDTTLDVENDTKNESPNITEQIVASEAEMKVQNTEPNQVENEGGNAQSSSPPETKENEPDVQLETNERKSPGVVINEDLTSKKSESRNVNLHENVEEVKASVADVIDEPICEDKSVSKVEEIGAIQNLRSEVNSLLAPLDADIKVLEPVGSVKASSESDEVSNILESATSTAASEIEEALSQIPEIKSSVSVQDMLEDTDKEDGKEDENTQTKSDGALIDITVIEESENKEKSTNEVVDEAKEAFIAEVIPDNADIEIETVDGEEVVELNFESKDAIPLGAIAVAAFAIFLALIFYYN